MSSIFFSIIFFTIIMLLSNGLCSFWIVYCFLFIAAYIVFLNINFWIIFTFLLFSFLHLFCICLHDSIRTLLWKEAFIVIITVSLVCLFFICLHVIFLICSEREILLILLLLPITIGLASTSGSAVLLAFYCFCQSASCILFVQLSVSLIYLWTPQSNCLCAFLFSVFLPVPTACLWCYGLLLAHSESLYLAYLAMLFCFLVLQKLFSMSYIKNKFLTLWLYYFLSLT